jgi:hypothetical protein
MFRTTSVTAPDARTQRLMMASRASARCVRYRNHQSDPRVAVPTRAAADPVDPTISPPDPPAADRRPPTPRETTPAELRFAAPNHIKAAGSSPRCARPRASPSHPPRAALVAAGPAKPAFSVPWHRHRCRTDSCAQQRTSWDPARARSLTSVSTSVSTTPAIGPNCPCLRAIVGSDTRNHNPRVGGSSPSSGIGVLQGFCPPA